MKCRNFVLICCSLLFGSICFAETDFSKPIILEDLNITKMRAESQQAASEGQKEVQAELNKKDEERKQKMLETQKQADQEIGNVEPGQTESQAAAAAKVKKEEMPMCDCYDIHDSNTFEGNFLYDAKGIRVQRKYPECKCEPPPQKPVTTKQSKRYSDYVLPPEVTKGNDQKANTNAEDASTKWNINY